MKFQREFKLFLDHKILWNSNYVIIALPSFLAFCILFLYKAISFTPQIIGTRILMLSQNLFAKTRQIETVEDLWKFTISRIKLLDDKDLYLFHCQFLRCSIFYTICKNLFVEKIYLLSATISSGIKDFWIRDTFYRTIVSHFQIINYLLAKFCKFNKLPLMRLIQWRRRISIRRGTV